jgi:hypothetical protein
VGLTRKEMTVMHGQMKATLSAFVECESAVLPPIDSGFFCGTVVTGALHTH